MKWKWIDADCTSVTTAEGTLTLKGLFIPLFIEQLLMNMTGTVNTLMLGHYADDAVAAVGAANQVIGFLYTFYAVFSGGASVVISHRLGAGDEKRASDAAFTSIVCGGAISLILGTILAFFAGAVMRPMQLETSVYEMAVVYFRICIGFSVLQGIISAISAVLRSYGKPKLAVMDTQENTILYTNQHFRKAFGEDVRSAGIEECLRQGAQSEDSLYFREVYSKEENRWFDLHSTRINWVDGRKVLLCTIYDVTDKKLYQQKIERQANNDFLTGLYNRMRCEQDLERYIRQTKEFGGEGALLYIDLDDFKHINDGLGHQYGDVLLKNISGSLQRIPGVENNCYRMGGDEFIIILAHHHMAMLQQILDEIKALFTKPWMLKGTDYYCTMSMGVVRFPADGDTVEELIKKADIALYSAKCAGKNRIEFYDDNVESTSYKRLDLEKNMRNATRNAFSEFEVYFQPIVNITKEGNPCAGAEALIRWNSGELGLIPPADFIPLAEYLGLINPIGEFVLREACIHCKYWNDMGHPEYKVNVNLSVVQLLQNDIVERIARVIEETRITPQNLTLEVTESLAVNDMSRMKRILADIRHLGVRVALDDFGTGYSSLNHIREMPIDVIKIDRCFIIDIGKDDFSNAFVKMVGELATAIHVNVCVEGVETKEQLDALVGSKVQLIQGFYFGKPMKAEMFERQYL